MVEFDVGKGGEVGAAESVVNGDSVKVGETLVSAEVLDVVDTDVMLVKGKGTELPETTVTL